MADPVNRAPDHPASAAAAPAVEELANGAAGAAPFGVMRLVKPCPEGECITHGLHANGCNLQTRKAGLTDNESYLVKMLLRIKHVYIAGGFAVLQAVSTLLDTENCDIDVFIVGSNEAEKRMAFNEVAGKLFQLESTLVAGVANRVVTFCLPTLSRNVQVIMSGAETPEELCAGFDIDACRAYLTVCDNRPPGIIQCYASDATKNCWHFMSISEAKRVGTPGTDKRLSKYWSRGFDIVFPFTISSRLQLAEMLHRARKFKYSRRHSHDVITVNMKAHMPRVHTVCFDLFSMTQAFSYKCLLQSDMGQEYDDEEEEVVGLPGVVAHEAAPVAAAANHIQGGLEGDDVHMDAHASDEPPAKC